MECGPVNPLSSLKKQLDANVFQDKFRGGSQLLHEGSSKEIAQQQQFAETFFQKDVLPTHDPFVFQEMHEAIREETQHGPFQHTSWHTEFQSFQTPVPKFDAYPPFEEVYQNALVTETTIPFENISSREQATSWAESFHSFRHASAVTLSKEEHHDLEKAFQQVRETLVQKEIEVPAAFDEHAFQADQWAKEFNGSALAHAAGEVLQGLDPLRGSAFAKFMEKLKNEELSIEGGELIEKTSWADDFQKTIDHFSNQTADIGLEDAFLQQGIEKDWAETFPDSWEDTPYTWNASLPQYMTYHMEPDNPFLKLSSSALESYSKEVSLPESILLLEAKLTHAPQDANLWCELGLKQQENEKEQQAIAALRQALQLNPQGALSAWLALAVSYTNENRTECATDALRHWLLRHPHYTSTTPDTAVGGGYVTPSVLAEMYLRTIQASATVDPDLQIGLGVLFNLTEQFERAVDCFHVALACRPYDAVLWNKLGATLANSNQSEKAVDAYFRALQIHPHYIRAQYNLGIACIHLKHYKEAMHQFLAALHHASHPSPHIWESLKTACLLMQRNDLAALCDQRDLSGLQTVTGMM